MKTIFVTGAAGFIGSNMCEKLLGLGYKVIGVDNFSTGKEFNLPIRRKKFIFYKLDLRNKEALDLIFSSHKFDVVMHIAGNASIVNAFDNPQSDVENNIIATMNVTNLCMEHGVPRLLYASTMVAYGENNIKRKEDNPCVPTSTYGITKYAAERYVINAGKRTDLRHDFNTTAFRMFNVYGPKQDLHNPYQGVVAIFIGKYQRRENITIHGNGKQTRDFIHVDDITNAWVSAINNKKTYGEVFNLGSGVETSIGEILKAVGERYHDYSVFPSTVEYVDARQGDIKRCVSDCSKMKKATGWKPKIKFKDGLDKLLTSLGR